VTFAYEPQREGQGQDVPDGHVRIDAEEYQALLDLTARGQTAKRELEQLRRARGEVNEDAYKAFAANCGVMPWEAVTFWWLGARPTGRSWKSSPRRS
jgi:hypothetical protein